uniref:receptor protein-tyrosine kinase n=1 Tax=Culicoides sonorensis TaxID=179676 RepID=A0A336LVG6_CULSO
MMSNIKVDDKLFLDCDNDWSHFVIYNLKLKEKFYIKSLKMKFQLNFMLIFVVISLITVIYCKDCHNIDVRNSASNLRRLEGCTAVLGYLRIVLIENDLQKNFENFSFPELREITGFLLAYRVKGLQSFRKLFPNLSIIRGNALFMNYALVLYDLENFQAIGLPSLQVINRGSVRIERCPQLCDVKTFNWKSITKNTSTNFFYENGEKCVQKPTQIFVPSNKICKIDPARNRTECFIPYEDTKPKVNPLRLCHESCIIGCHNKTASGCFACKGPQDDGVCVEQCPETKIYDESFMRCVTREQCRSYKRYIYEENQICVSVCPKGYQEKESSSFSDGTRKTISDYTCHPCPMFICPKYCRGGEINYVDEAQRFHGCTIINGSLHIRMNIAADRPELMDELAEYLGAIEEIHGYLKIFRSFPITTLQFLKNLRVIHGYDLEDDIYGLLVYENNNLQALWTPHKDFKLLKGSMHFYSNDKLCPYLVREFLKATGHKGTKADLDSNGSRHSCNVTVIDVKYKVLSPTSATIYWEPFYVGNTDRLTGYLINYVESVHTNMTHYYGTYSCTVTSWDTKSVKLSEITRTEDNYMAFNLTELSPMTQYAIYVRTEFQDNYYRTQGQSPIRYFKTPIDSLTQVLNLTTYAKSSTSITLTWTVMPKEEDYIKFYTVDILRQPDDQVIYGRDFCKHPHEKSAYEMQEIETNNEECCCQNSHDNIDYGMSPAVTEYTSSSTIITSSKKKARIKRETNDLDEYFGNNEEPLIADVTKYKYYVDSIVFMPNQTIDNNRYEITGLKPFVLYSFQFFACMNVTICSPYTFHSDRTRPDSDADTVNVTVNQSGEQNKTISITFETKNETSGAIVGYIIEQRREMEGSYSVSQSNCISKANNFLWNQTYTIDTLPPGNTQLRFQTISLAGLGPFTEWFNVTVLEPPATVSPFNSFMLALFISCLICSSFYGFIWFKHNRMKICHPKPPEDRNEFEMLVMSMHGSNFDDNLQDIPLGDVHFEEAEFY